MNTNFLSKGSKLMKLKLVAVLLISIFLVRVETPAAPQAGQPAQVALPQQGPAEVRVQLEK